MPLGVDSLLPTVAIALLQMASTPGQPANVIRKPRSRVVRGIYLVLGVICVGFAYLSWLPGIPTFDFVVLAAFFFARSSDRFHNWLVHHRVFGRIIRGYRIDGFSVRTKIVASLAVAASLSFSILALVDNPVVRAVLGLVGLYALWFIWTRKAKPTTVPDPRGTLDVH